MRQKENSLASCRAKITNDSVLALHAQLRSKRDQMRMEQTNTIRQQQVKIIFGKMMIYVTKLNYFKLKLN